MKTKFNEGIKRLLIGFVATVILVVLSIYEKQKVDWIDIFLWIAPFCVVIIVILLEAQKKRKNKLP
jgi:hypothetical protein